MIRGPRSRATTLVALGALSSFGPLSLDLYLPALPRVATDFGVSDGTAQLSLSACLVGLAVGQLFAGPLSDRLGRRRPLLIGVAIWAITSLLCALSPTAWALIVLRLIQGLGGAAGLAIARAIVRDLFEGRAIARAFAILALVSGVTPVAAPILGSQLLPLTGWRGLFWILAGIGAILVWLAWWALPESLAPELRHAGGVRQIGRAARVVGTDRGFLGAAGVQALAGAVLFTYIAMSSFVLQQQFGLSAREFGAAFATNSVGIVLFGLITAFALRRFDERRVLGVSASVMATASLLLLLAIRLDAPLLLTLAPLFVAVATIGSTMPTASALALMDQARNAGTASALLGAAQYLIGAVAGPLASSGGASGTAMATAMAIAACGGVVVFATVTRGRARPAAPLA